MKKILVLAIMALGVSTNVFACFGNSMIESMIKLFVQKNWKI